MEYFWKFKACLIMGYLGIEEIIGLIVCGVFWKFKKFMACTYRLIRNWLSWWVCMFDFLSKTE